MTVISEDINIPGSAGVPERMSVLVGPCNDHGEFIDVAVPSLDILIRSPAAIDVPAGSGVWSADLVPTGLFSPAGIMYKRIIADSKGWSEAKYFHVPNSGTYALADVELEELNAVSDRALGLHVSDTSLHGGGVIIDDHKVTSNITLSGGANSYQEVARVTIPVLVRPVLLKGIINVQAITSGTITGHPVLCRADQMNDLGIRDMDYINAAGLVGVHPIGLKGRVEVKLEAGEGAGVDWVMAFKKLGTGTGQVLATTILLTKLEVLGA